MTEELRELLAAAIASLERCGCQFWACEGETLNPIDMVTCHRCAALAQLSQYMRDHVGND